MKSVLIQGATGSIGSSALSVLAEQRGEFRVTGLAARSRQNELLDLARIWKPKSLALNDAHDETALRRESESLGVDSVFIGEDAALRQAAGTEYDVLLNAMVGGAGIAATLSALDRGKSVALANKETLVAAGDLVMESAKRNNAQLLPIDSEHSAILQCLAGESWSGIRTLWLTTSGGPFWGRRQSELHDVTPEQALKHPTWVMGAKITIDSATLFNKGLEVIEACKLFGVDPAAVKVIRHRESVIHSMVEFTDGSFKAQLSNPDMRLPILYALSHPNRVVSGLVASSPSDWSALHFDEVSFQDFPCLRLAYDALDRGGTIPCAMSAADEVAVQAFLEKRISFTAIPEIIENTMNTVTNRSADSLENILLSDAEARQAAHSLCRTHEIVAGDLKCS
ncbi:1-deoxy-D-xylulose-5-phosphate reductoisomerase [bacterium]|nr:1-deoxy-D-xylulose-5-phosphate reductoisomerase [bacterium]